MTETTSTGTAQRIADGERRREKGMSLAAMGRYRQRLETQAGLLAAMLRSPEHTATSDDATSTPHLAYVDRGPWRGPAIRELLDDGLIECIDHVRSTRPSRHRATVRVWRLVDVEAGQMRLDAIRRRLAALPAENATGEVAPSTIADTESTPTSIE